MGCRRESLGEGLCFAVDDLQQDGGEFTYMRNVVVWVRLIRFLYIINSKDKFVLLISSLPPIVIGYIKNKKIYIVIGV